MGTTFLDRFAVPVASFEFGLDRLPIVALLLKIYFNKKIHPSDISDDVDSVVSGNTPLYYLCFLGVYLNNVKSGVCQAFIYPAKL
jgi:hypothetical protein